MATKRSKMRLEHSEAIKETAVQSFRRDSRNFNIHLPGMDRPSRETISKDTVDPKSIINPQDLTEAYGTLHTTRGEEAAVHMGRSARETAFLTRKHILTNLKEQKSYKVCSQTAMKLN